MPKTKTSVFFCKNCGAESAKWLGKCPVCNEWNTIVEEAFTKNDKHQPLGRGEKARPVPQKINEIIPQTNIRLSSQDAELDRVLGGGIVAGALILIGGEPGIGKSTLLLQVALLMQNVKVLYISGEESDQQIKLRAERLSQTSSELFIYTETHTGSIFKQLATLQPQLVIIDSIQTLYTDAIEATPGSISQIRECTGELMRYAKESQVPVFIVGHITKDGAIAGPKVLEHMVDTVIQFEGDRNYTYRILRTIKNRFGSTSELGIYEMSGAGLRAVENPSEILITQREEQPTGIAVGAMVEGIRPILIEAQALVSDAVYGTPQRSATGFDTKRLNMLLAVLDKRCGFRFGMKDVFVNIAGGLRVEDPAIDLAIVASLISSHNELVIPSYCAFAAEVGLSGEIRGVNRVEQRVAEAERLGFKRIYISKYNQKSFDASPFNIEIRYISKVNELM
jgi:DNA repair protein RadA/Sms